MKQYDYIVAGGGCAGLSLAYYLAGSPLRTKRVLIIDAENKESNDRTWCFWGDQPTAFDDIITRQWPVMGFADEHGEKPGALGNMRYKMIRSADFYRKVKTAIARHPGFEILQARISEMGESGAGAYVIADGQRYEAGWVFNSLLQNEGPPAAGGPYHFLLQHFTGWWIRCKEPVFDPEKGMLMDFRTPQYRSTRFLYVLPFSRHEALVEHTVFSSRKLHPKSYERALEAYISETLGAREYTITDVEHGAIPMTDKPFPASTSAHIINIGIAGGAVKPSTGYAFCNIQHQARQITAQLSMTGSPVLPPPPASRFRFYDSLLLNILQDYGEEGKFIFGALFRRNGMRRILRFLDEDTSIWEEARIFATLPLAPFLRALVLARLWPAFRKLSPGRWHPSGRKAPDVAYGIREGVKN